MILFPIAFLWLALVVVWVIKNDSNQPGADGEPRRGDGRRFRPFGPRDPASEPAGGRGRSRLRRRASGEASARKTLSKRR